MSISGENGDSSHENFWQYWWGSKSTPVLWSIKDNYIYLNTFWSKELFHISSMINREIYAFVSLRHNEEKLWSTTLFTKLKTQSSISRTKFYQIYGNLKRKPIAFLIRCCFFFFSFFLVFFFYIYIDFIKLKFCLVFETSEHKMLRVMHQIVPFLFSFSISNNKMVVFNRT